VTWFRRRASPSWSTAAWIGVQVLILIGFLDAIRYLRL
jgi:hypothetical protein